MRNAADNKKILPEKIRKKRKINRKEISLFPRLLLLLITILIMLAALAAGYATYRDLIIPLPTKVYKYERATDVSYQVLNRSSEFMNQSVQGMDLVYLSDYAQKILPVIKYEIAAESPAEITGTYQMMAILRIKDKTDPNSIIFEKTIALADQVELDLIDSNLNIEQSAQVDLHDIYLQMQDFEQETALEVSYELELGLQTDLDITKNGNLLRKLQERPGLVMPLGTDTFTIRNQAKDLQKETVWQIRYWQLLITPLPVVVYIIIFSLGLIFFVFSLLTTKNKKRPRFNRQLRKMLAQAKGRLMLISDKAWEPEWCITVANFKTMMQTARKLGHPVFCYIDADSKVPTAFFYVYYGENNYCYTFTGKPDKRWNKKKNRNTTDYQADTSMDTFPLPVSLPHEAASGEISKSLPANDAHIKPDKINEIAEPVVKNTSQLAEFETQTTPKLDNFTDNLTQDETKD